VLQSTNRFVISDFGAVGDGHTLNTKAIQGTIDRCGAKGGGIIVVPKGTFITGSLFLKQGVNLCVESEGVLKGSQNTNDYPWINTRIAGLELKWPAALINADGLTNLTLAGPGTIDGSGERWWREYWDTRQRDGELDPFAPGCRERFGAQRPRLLESAAHLLRGSRSSKPESASAQQWRAGGQLRRHRY
jgi:polygalacturonase